MIATQLIGQVMVAVHLTPAESEEFLARWRARLARAADAARAAKAMGREP